MTAEAWADWSRADQQQTDERMPKEHRCQSCGGHVTTNFLRVFGDNSDVVHGCVNCTTSRERRSQNVTAER